MPWTADNPPAVAKNWTVAERTRCVAAGNAALAAGKSEADAVYACIAAAGKSKTQATLGACLRLRLIPKAGVSSWMPLGEPQSVTLGGAQVPSQRFSKEVVAIGQYVKVSDGIAFTVTQESLDNWAFQFKRMREAGVKVPLPFGEHKDEKWEAKVRKAGDPRENAGWVDDLFVQRDKLVMVCNLSGKDALEAAPNSDVSINARAQFVDGTGNAYVWPITHIAMVTDPVIPGLGDFVPLAASLGLQEQVVMLEFLQKMAAALGLDPAQIVDEQAGGQLILDAIAALVEKAGGVEPAPGAVAPPVGAAAAPTPGAPAAGAAGTPRKTTTTTEFAASAGKAGDGAPEPAPIMVKTLVENRRLKLQQRVESGHISPAQATKYAELYASEDAIKLALSSGSDGSDFDKLLEVIDLGEPMFKKGTKTGPQTFALSDSRKGDGKPKKSPLVACVEGRVAATQKATA